MKSLKLLADTPLRHLPLTLALTLILTLNNNPIPNFSNPTKPYFGVGAKLQATNRVPRPVDRGTATRYGG